MQYGLFGMFLILYIPETKQTNKLNIIRRSGRRVFSEYLVVSGILIWVMLPGCVYKVKLYRSVNVRFVHFCSLCFDIKRLPKNKIV